MVNNSKILARIVAVAILLAVPMGFAVASTSAGTGWIAPQWLSAEKPKAKPVRVAKRTTKPVKQVEPEDEEDQAVMPPPVNQMLKSGTLIVVSKGSQQMHVFKDGQLWDSSPVSTGKKGHETPVGMFPILQKKKFHRSNIYSNAPMPHMQRLTWDGIAIHAGHVPGYPASHGCIRVPAKFAKELFGATQYENTTVVVTDAEFASEASARQLALTMPNPLPGPRGNLVQQTDVQLAKAATPANGQQDGKTAATNTKRLADSRTQQSKTGANAPAKAAPKPAPKPQIAAKTAAPEVTKVKQPEVSDAEARSNLLKLAAMVLDRLQVPAGATPIDSTAPSDSPNFSGSGETIQLTAAGSREEAESYWNTIKQRHPELQSYEKAIYQATVGSRQVYRLRVNGPNATSTCSAIRQSGKDCFAVS